MEPRILEQLIIKSDIDMRKHNLKYRALYEFGIKYNDMDLERKIKNGEL